MSKKPAFDLRPMAAEHLNYVLTEWANSNRVKDTDHSDATYGAGMQRRVARLLRTGQCIVAVGEEPGLLGWICWKPWNPQCLIVHYLYVRPNERRKGLGAQLLMAAGWKPGMATMSTHDIVTHIPHIVRKRIGLQRNKFLLEEIAEW